jgi:hypothetical protein
MKDWNQLTIPFQEKIQSLASNKKNLMLICGCAAGILLLLLLLVISLGMNHNRDEMKNVSEKVNQLLAPQAIKPEELFLPDEPDFIPEVMLNREPRDVWTNEDAEQFWVDPLQENSDVWKNRIIKAVDDIMENIP